MIAVDDAKQDWGFLQHVDAKHIPLHGSLQTETDLGFTTGGGHFLFREGGNIKRRYGRISLHLTKSCATINMHWMLSYTVLSAQNIISVFIKVKT